MDNTPPHSSDAVELNEPHTPPPTTGTLGPNDPATPIVANNATGSNYVSDHIGREENYQKMSREIAGKVVGPMPPTTFLDTFLPEASNQGPEFDQSELNIMNAAPTEVAMYKPFIDTFNTCCPRLLISDTHSNRFPTFEEREISPDISVYENRSQFATSATQSTNRPIDEVVFMVEFKHDHGDDPFRDDISGFEHNEKTLICAYATAHMAAQFRSHVFSLLIFPGYARILRWDRAGVVVTGKIDLENDQDASKLGEFFWRYQNMTNAQKGYDENVTRINNVGPDVVKILGAKKDSPFFSVKFPGNKLYIITKPTYMGIGSPTGRSTRTFKAFCTTTKKLVFLKDTWRVIHPGILPEHEIYQRLGSKKIPHVATLTTYHDMINEVMRTKDFAQAEWVKFNGPKSFRKFQHYRLVLEEVRRPIQSFHNVRELIQVFRNALQAHRLAHDMAGILHRDISAGNIMITEKGRGLLVDWDLSKLLVNTSGALSPPERTGTWQFLAARLILDREPGTPPPIPNRDDDLESFWHVLFWVALRHCDHQMKPSRIVDLLAVLFDHKYIDETGKAQGGDFKRNSLTSRGSITDMKLGSNVLRMIFLHTAKLLASRYPDDEEENDIQEVQRMWEKLQSENANLDSEEHLAMELTLRIAKTGDMALLAGRIPWAQQRILETDVEWMEKIFENALKDPSTDWETGSANIQRTWLHTTASKASKRKSELDVDGRKPKKVSNLGSLPE